MTNAIIAGERMSGTGRTAKIWTLAVAVLLLLGALLLPRPALAGHDQGYICYVCHSLNPAELRAGSNAIRQDQQVLATIPPSGTVWAGGNPVSCDFCHRAASDIPTQNMATKAKKHPVDLIQTGNLNPTNEITCNDCHDNATQDVVPSSLLVKNTTDGYPDHKSVDNVYSHNLTNNPPHLHASWPYYGATVPGANRTNDGVFWTAVKNDTQNILCWRCHDGVNTAPYTTGVRSSKVVKADYTGAGAMKGHQIQTSVSGGLAVGSALPCYNCHDSHGSVNNALILDNNSIYNDCTSLLAVTTYNQGARPYNDKVVCAGCHDTNNASTLTTKAGGVATMVEGMYPVDPFNGPSSALHIASGITTVMTSSTRNCLGANAGCHASPHNPVGESTGGQNCASCHAEYASMRNTSTYQHAMYDNGFVYPNAAPAASGTDTNRRCIMCHVDHNIFNGSINASTAKDRGGNLRTRIQDNAVTVSANYDNTDYNNTNGGLCLSCHGTAVQLAKNTSNQKTGLTPTQVVTPSVAAFDGSAHKYAVNATFSADGSGFAAVCTKCHTTEGGASYNSLGFSLHNAASGQLLAQFGRTVAADNLEQLFCYGCHSEVGDMATTAGGKSTNGQDWYQAAGQAMPNASEKTYKNFNQANGSRHPLSGNHTTTASVECENCHNPHIVRSTAGNRVVNPDNTLALAAYSTVADNVAFCIKCHDGAPPARLNNTTTLVPYAVVIPVADNVLMNKNRYPTRNHWTNSGSFAAGTIQACSKCHDNHGSTAKSLLGTYDPAANNSKIYGTQATITLYTTATPSMADNQAVCSACHTNVGGNYPSTTVNAANIAAVEAYRDASGYFSVAGQISRWPGKTVWDNTSVSPHNTAAKNAPAALGGRAVGDCNTCHDPHGTAYNYNLLTDNMAAGNYKLCFDCHGLAGSPANTDNVARYYPVASQGLGAAASATVNTGHNIKTGGGLLTQYTALPCYDCHVTHGSRNGNTQLKSDQRWSNLGDTRNNAANNRAFCLGCHVASDDAATAGTVEGLTRQTAGANKLKLPTANPIVEHAAASTQSCGACHAGLNYNDNTYGPHHPASGLCDTCHVGQGTRSAGAIGFNGSHLKHSDNTTYRLACKQCHSWTRPSNPAVHKDNTSAVQYAQVAFDNEAVNWSTIQYATAIQYEYKSSSINPYGGAVLTPTYTGGTDNGTDTRQASIRWKNGTCSNIWCHSNANPVGSTNVFDTVNWGGTVTCGVDCHGNDGQSGRARIGDGASATRGSAVHYKHVAAIQCNNCHYYTLTGANTTITAFDNHVNGVKNVRFAPSIGGTYDNVNRTCSGTSCHGTPAPLPDWDNVATVSNCFSCHQGTEQTYKPQSNNTTPNPVNSTQYTTAGHGRTSAYPVTLNPAASFDNVASECYYCHSQNAVHAPTADNVNDPYRLGYGADTTGQIAGSARGAWADNTNGLCLKCHGTTAERSGVTVGLATTAYNDNNHDMAHAKVRIGVWTFTPKCVDCHDPHGDTNIAMIRSGINAPTSATDNNVSTGAGSNTKGTPLRTTNITSITFTSNAGYAAGSYAIPGGIGICEVCHNQTTLFSRTLDNTGTHASRTGNCVGCHSHGTGFKGAGHSAGSACKGCHTTAQAGRREIAPDFNGTAQHGGAYASITDADCELCHVETSSDGIIILKQWTAAGGYNSITYGTASTDRANTNLFCLSCHNGGAGIKSFSVGGAPANVGTYWVNTTTVSHNSPPSSTVNTTPVMTKARSAHAFPSTNMLKQEVGTGVKAPQSTYTDAAPVACTGCHPSHGSSFRSAVQGKGTALVTGGKMLSTANEPNICWSCHDSTSNKVRDYWGDNTAGGHWTGTLNSNIDYKRRAILSTHNVNDNADIACSICHNPHGSSGGPAYYTPMLRGTWLTSPYFEDRAGRLTTTTKTTLASISKLTQSRYGPRGSADVNYNRPARTGGGYTDCATTASANGQDGYFIDENTFGYTGTLASSWATSMITALHMPANDNLDTNFGGLCANCHTSTAYAGGTVAAMKTYLAGNGGYGGRGGDGLTGWSTRIHNTVAGWTATGTTGDRVNPTSNPRLHGYSMRGTCTCMAYDTGCSAGWSPWRGHTWQTVPNTTNQMASAATAIHKFPCSKCHTPHASVLPRLSTTNCIDVGASTTFRKAHGTGTGAQWNYPSAPTQVSGTPRNGAAMLCHNINKTNTTAGLGWNKVTGW